MEARLRSRPDLPPSGCPSPVAVQSSLAAPLSSAEGKSGELAHEVVADGSSPWHLSKCVLHFWV